MRLLVIDGNSIANRAFFGIKLLTTKDGRYTNAIYGFLNILLSLLKECEPDEVAVAFDLKAPTFRHKMYDGYKATRHGMPEELAQQMPVLKELLADLGYRTVTAEEADAMFRQKVAPRFPGLSGRVLQSKACMYTVTPDRHFVIDSLPGTPNVLVASACSGHGFKHSAGLGDAIAEQVLGLPTAYDLSAFRINRLLG